MSSVAQTKESLKQYNAFEGFRTKIFPLPIWFRLKTAGDVVSLIASPKEIFTDSNLAKKRPLDLNTRELVYQQMEFISIVSL